MEGLLVLFRLIVAAMLAVAGIGKLFDPKYASTGRWSLAAVALMSVVEILVAFGLVTAAYAWIASIVAAILLLGSLSYVVVRVSRGTSGGDCRCFGRIGSLPMNVASILYCSLLAAMATFVALQGDGHSGPALNDWWGAIPDGQRVRLAVVVILVGVLASSGRVRAATASLLNPKAQPSTGLYAPLFEVIDEKGTIHTPATMCAEGRPVLLVFANLGDDRSRAVMGEVGVWQRQFERCFNTWVLDTSPTGDLLEERRRYGLTRTARRRSARLLTSYSVVALPSAILVSREGHIASRLAVGPVAIRALADAATRECAPVAEPRPTVDAALTALVPNPCGSCGS